MVATKIHWKRLGLLSLSLYSQLADALELERVKFLFNFFKQNSDSGKQVLDNKGDESATVFEPMLFVAAKVDENTDISAQFVFDAWTAASDTVLDDKTGASGGAIDGQTRFGGQFKIRRGDELNSKSLSLGISTEYDYKSLNFGANLTNSYAEDNFTLSLTPTLYLDQAKDFDIDRDIELDYKSRLIYAFDVSATQLLTPKDLIQFGYTFVGMNGMLNSIAGTVQVEDITTNPYQRTQEVLPSSKMRHAFSTKYVHGFTDQLGLHFSHRYYQDDWDLKANTFETGLRIGLNEDRTFIMPTLRYHQQNEVEYYQDKFSTREQYMTSDSDLAEFDSTRYGVHAEHILEDKKVWGHQTDWSISFGAYHYDRSNGLDYQIMQVGIGVGF